MSAGEEPLSAWEPRLRALADEIRTSALGAMRRAIDRGTLAEVDRPIAQGVGDATYGLDLPTERVLSAWLRAQAARAPLSLLTEDAGWRHYGPGRRPSDEPRELAGFDHGGPRIVVDPVDGTRNLMADLRSAWTAIALCPPGARTPRLAEVAYGLLSELPDSRAARYRILEARAGAGAKLEERAITTGEQRLARALRADEDDRPDHGYFPFFCYSAAMRPQVAALAADFFARLEREEGATLRHCYDDQYISNAGQLALLALGTYRMIADLRTLFLARTSGAQVTSKPYDCAAAILIAREVGCAVRSAAGGELDFDLDARTPVGFIAWANEATRARLERHYLRALTAAGLA